MKSGVEWRCDLTFVVGIVEAYMRSGTLKGSLEDLRWYFGDLDGTSACGPTRA